MAKMFLLCFLFIPTASSLPRTAQVQGAILEADDVCSLAGGASQDCALHALQTRKSWQRTSDSDGTFSGAAVSSETRGRDFAATKDAARAMPNSSSRSNQSTRSRAIQKATPVANSTLVALLKAERGGASGNLSHAELFTEAYSDQCRKSAGFCTGPCSQESGAKCTNNQCMCPFATCVEDGICRFNQAEVQRAVESGATNVVGRVTQVARMIPGVADTVAAIEGHLAGVGGSISGIVGSVTGYNENHVCSNYISTCFLSDCDASLGLTVECTYNTCKCKHGFCARDGSCEFDIASVIR